MRRVQLTEQGRGPKNRTCLGLLTTCTSEVCHCTLCLGRAGAESCRAGPPPPFTGTTACQTAAQRMCETNSHTSCPLGVRPGGLFKAGPPKYTSGCSGRLLVAVAFGLGLVAFGSVSVAPGSAPGSVPFRWGPTPKEKRAPTPKPAVIFLIGIPFTRCSWTMDLSIRSIASAGHMVVCVVTVQMVVGDRRFPGATTLGVEVVYFLRQPSVVSPADRSRTF